MKCRHCSQCLRHLFLDLGFAPPSNAYLSEQDLSRPECHYPLRARVCDRCWLVQTEDYLGAKDLFRSDYAYFSSTSPGWLAHSREFAQSITALLRLDRNSLVIEVACNDGYLLRNFVAEGIPCLGIEPSSETAATAESLGVPVVREFFDETLGKKLASEGRGADLVVGFNVYAHVPDVNGFTRGLKAVLNQRGTVVLEFPHLLRLLEHTQFDTVYHEHFSYLSLHVVSEIFRESGLRVLDVNELETHGGSLRVFGCHEADDRETSSSVAELIDEEKRRGLRTLDPYAEFQAKADRVKDDLLEFLLTQKRAGKRVIGYGAAAKGNTLLNYAGIRSDLLPLVCDASGAKQGKFLPGSHIPICSPEVVGRVQPDYVLILPWNIADEIRRQLTASCAPSVRFVTAIPALTVQ